MEQPEAVATNGDEWMRMHSATFAAVRAVLSTSEHHGGEPRGPSGARVHVGERTVQIAYVQGRESTSRLSRWAWAFPTGCFRLAEAVHLERREHIDRGPPLGDFRGCPVRRGF